MQSFWIVKNETNRVKVGYGSYEGKNYIEVREFFTKDGGVNWIATSKGATFPVKSIEDFKEGVAMLDDEHNGRSNVPVLPGYAGADQDEDIPF